MDSKDDDHEKITVKDALEAIRKDIENLQKKKTENRGIDLLSNKIDPAGNVINLNAGKLTKQSDSEAQGRSDDQQFSKILEKNIFSRLNKGEKIEEIINYFLHKILSVWLDKTLSGSLSQLLKNEGSSVVPSLNANFDETTADDSISVQEGKKDSEIIRLTNIVKNDFV
ncbi:MAG: hypothetical protein VX585_01415 [Pseudomonadota bacterium]|nr:hypothetical protein [Pseudomonadota bacterium]MED5339287.1 hypothetical protein [Pseudomonadota bacterium]MEE3206196.1 hypothetical protein [Pseudomonadota bacterium]MEE3260207.1 hypothetical protein [Pseudomonadota bacterium]